MKKQKEEVNDVIEEKVEEPEVVEEQKEPTQEEIITSLEAEIKQLKNDLLKQHADLDNTKKRLEKERMIERKYAAMSFAKKLLTPVDNFDLALNHLEDDHNINEFKKGIEMIKNQLSKLLEEEGVSEIDALGEEYDPNFHQAIMTEKIEGTDPNHVVQVLQKGYMFKERVIRPAIVKISE